MEDIRFLVENYYDIQKLRVETFNRLVMFIKENVKQIMSQLSLGTQSMYASHGIDGAQRFHASQLQHGTHTIYASELLEKKKYAEFVKKYVLNEKIKIAEVENIVWFHNKLYETERELYKRLDAWSIDHPLRKRFLNYVKGIGPILSSGIISWFSDPILKADYVSQIWSYCGLSPQSTRKKGEKTKYNPRVKTFCWKIGQSFIKFKCFGRKLYDDFKEQAKEKHKDWSKLHIHNYTRRKVVKLFIASIWETWRKLNNLPITDPYPIEFQGHKNRIVPEKWIEKK
jgi:hypothetical protein